MLQPGLFRQRDEHPPANIWQDRGGQQWIRLIPRTDNGGPRAALSGGRIYADLSKSHRVSERSICVKHQSNKATELRSRTVAITRSFLALDFANMQPFADDGVPANSCYFSTFVNDSDFALSWMTIGMTIDLLQVNISQRPHKLSQLAQSQSRQAKGLATSRSDELMAVD